MSRTIHGFARTRFYTVWKGMRQRCKNSNHPSYKNYGGRGIEICEGWDKFVNFKEDMHLRYTIRCLLFGKDNTTLDRIDNDGDYTPENCRWTDRYEQSKNSRQNRLFLATRIEDRYKEIGRSQHEFANRHGISRYVIKYCLNPKTKNDCSNGWKFEYLEDREDYNLIMAQLR